MRKNLLTVMLGFSFMLIGAATIRAEASNAAAFNNNIRSVFVKKSAELKELCKNNVGLLCDLHIELADQAADLAAAACGAGSPNCYELHNWALGVFDRAMDSCRNESNVNFRKPKNVPFRDSRIENPEDIQRTE